MNQSTAKRLTGIMRTESDRAMASIRRPRYPRPFFISFLVRDEETWTIEASFGSLSDNDHQRKRNCYCDVRIGSYLHDQVLDGALNDNSKEEDSFHSIEIPFGRSDLATQHGLWRQAEVRYREAVEALAAKQSFELTYLDRNRTHPSFQKHSAVEANCWQKMPEPETGYWQGFVEKTSSVARSEPRIVDSYVRFKARNRVRVLVNSEGSQIIQSTPYWSLECYLWMLSDNGDALPWTVNHFVTNPLELPDTRRFQREIRDAIEQLRKLAAAPELRSYAGPVLLNPEPAGLLMHEAFGHRLEGNRMLSTGEGQTFRDSVGQEVLPPFLSMRDDPQLREFDGKSLVGHYHYDDEGVAAQNVDLIDKGVLRRFLTSRAGIAKRHKSNGHGRCDYHERPISRMGVTIIEAENGCDDAQLKQQLLQEVERQKLPYGIRIISATGGETATESYNFQAFLGEINLAARVFPDGREELVRGVDFVGTPLNAARSIHAAGNQYEVDNAFCGAESGWVPVSTISPALMVSRLELQAKSDTPYSPHCYPIPWA